MKHHLDPSWKHNRTDTSAAAAAGMVDKAPNLREQVHEHLMIVGPYGGSNEEIAFVTGIRLDTVKPRAHELWLDGRVARLRARRTGSAGAAVVVWCAAVHVNGREVDPVPERQPSRRQLLEEIDRLNRIIERDGGFPVSLF